MKFKLPFPKPFYVDVLRNTLIAAAVIGVFIVLINQQTTTSNQAKVSAQLIQNQQQTIKQLKNSVTTLENNSDAKLTDLQNHIDCIVELFQQPNRANLILTDVTNCKLSPIPSMAASSTTPSSGGSPTAAPKVTSTIGPTGPTPPSSSSSASPPSPSPAASSPTPAPGILRQLLNFLGL